METKQMHVEDKPLIDVHPKKRTFFFIILYCLFVFDFIARVGINAIFPVIQADLGLSDTEVGMMGSVVLLGMGVLVLPVSFLGEKYSKKKAITLSALVWSVGTLLSGMASSFYLLLVSRFMVGAGNSAYAPLSNSMITSMYYKKDWGKKIGVYNTAMTAGVALGAIVFANIANTWGWRMTFYIVGIISFLFAIASLTLPEENGKSSKEENVDVDLKKALQVIISNKTLLGMCFASGISALVIQGILSWQSIFFVREMNMSIGIAASIISASALVSAIGYPLGGAIMDRWYVYDKRCRVYIPIIFYSLSMVCLLLGFYFKVIPLLFLGVFFTTTADTSFHVSTQELVPSWFKAVSYGVYVVFIQLFGAIGPVLTGMLSDILGLKVSLSVIQLLMIFSIVSCILVCKTYLSDFEKARQCEQEAGIY